jgi:hypothetical protein
VADKMDKVAAARSAAAINKDKKDKMNKAGLSPEGHLSAAEWRLSVAKQKKVKI